MAAKRNGEGKAGAASAEGAGARRVGVRKAYKMLIGGAFVRSESGRYIQMALGDQAGSTGDGAENFPRGSRKDVRDAVLAAHAAWAGWTKRTAFNRAQILYRLGEMMEARRGELVASLALGGATDAEAEVDASIDRAIAFAGWCDKYQSLFSSLNPVAGPHFDFTSPDSMGVIGVAAPRRPALLGLIGSVLPIVAGGNACVVLASEDDPRTACVLGELLATSDLPGGVVNILTGGVREMLPHLAKHMEVAALDLHGVPADLEKAAQEAAIINVKRVRVRALAERDWYDAARTEAPSWIERFVEMRTVWHPAGP